MRTDDRQPTPAAVDEVVLHVVSAWAPDPGTAVTMDHRLQDDLQFTSLRLVELAFILEELLGMDPAAMGEAPFIETVGDLRDFLREKMDAGEATLPDRESVDRLVASMR